MIPLLFHTRLRRHAEGVFRELFPEGFEGEVFLCGGAFKSLLRRRLAINDFDLWVRNRKDREKLIRHLLQRGASLVRDFHPFCLKLRLNGRIIEVTYHNVNDGTLADVVNTFDIAVCGMGARYKNGVVEEIHVSEECRQSIRHRSIQVLPAYLCFLDATHAPSLIRTLHRMGQQATELGYEVDVTHEHMLWEMFWKDYTEEERRTAVDLYFETMVHYKGHCDDGLVRRATVGYAPVEFEDLHSGHLYPGHA